MDRRSASAADSIDLPIDTGDIVVTVSQVDILVVAYRSPDVH